MTQYTDFPRRALAILKPDATLSEARGLLNSTLDVRIKRNLSEIVIAQCPCRAAMANYSHFYPSLVLAVLEKLEQLGMDLDEVYSYVDVHGRKVTRTLLHFGVEHGSIEFVECLLRKDADPMKMQRILAADGNPEDDPDPDVSQDALQMAADLDESERAVAIRGAIDAALARRSIQGLLNTPAKLENRRGRDPIGHDGASAFAVQAKLS